MGQKSHPTGLRLGYIKDWQSRWFTPKGYAAMLHEDIRIRRYIKNRFVKAGVAKIEMERDSKRLKITIHTARPGIVIGKKGAEIEDLRRHVEGMTTKQIIINIEEIKRPDTVAQLVAENVAGQLERRISFRRAMKRSMQLSMELGALGIRVAVAGRLGGSELARREGYLQGKVPLHTLRANIEYGFSEAHTTAGKIGIKVWICKKEEKEEERPHASYA